MCPRPLPAENNIQSLPISPAHSYCPGCTAPCTCRPEDNKQITPVISESSANFIEGLVGAAAVYCCVLLLGAAVHCCWVLLLGAAVHCCCALVLGAGLCESSANLFEGLRAWRVLLAAAAGWHLVLPALPTAAGGWRLLECCWSLLVAAGRCTLWLLHAVHAMLYHWQLDGCSCPTDWGLWMLLTAAECRCPLLVGCRPLCPTPLSLAAQQFIPAS